MAMTGLRRTHRAAPVVSHSDTRLLSLSSCSWRLWEHSRQQLSQRPTTTTGVQASVSRSETTSTKGSEGLAKSPEVNVARPRHGRDSSAPNMGLGAVRRGSYKPTNLGQSYGSATVVPRPDIGITGFRGSVNPNDPFHALNRAIDRGVSPQTILETVRNPAAVLEQSSGRFLYLGDQGAVRVRPRGNGVYGLRSGG